MPSEFTYAPYPRYKSLPDGTSRIVKNEIEEAEVDELARQLSAKEKEEIAAIIQDEPGKEEVWAEADRLGVIYDKRWSLPKIIKEIRAAELRSAE